MATRVRAVLFDLFNTLIPGGSRAERDGASRLLADALGVGRDNFAALIRATFDDRTRGRLGDLHETVRRLAHRLGANPSDAGVEEAVELRLEMTRALHHSTWALPVLHDLAARGVTRGLVSDCSAETPEVWAHSPLSPCFEAVSFSCETGCRKPEPEAYVTAVRRLGAIPEDCLFVRDGGSFELTGAEALAITAIRFASHGATAGDAIDQDDEWSGPCITDLADLLVRL